MPAASADRRFLLENPDLFLVHYFPHTIQKLEDFHLQLIETATTQRRGLVLYPAAHGKTTLVSTLLPIWALCRDPDIRMALIAKNDVDAKGIMRAVHAELLGNRELIRDYGPFRDETGEKAWALERIEVARRTIRHKSATLAAFGVGARTAIGYRTDWTICDDIITDVNSATEEQRAKVEDWFNLGPETMGEAMDDRLTVVGTLFHPEDLYHDLQELRDPEDGEQIWHVDRFDAIVDEDERITLWAERWNWKRLMLEKAAKGTLAFNKRYRNIAVDPSRMVFKEEYIKGGYSRDTRERYPGCLDESYVVGDYDETWHRYSGFDPAVGKGRSAKFCAHLTLGVGSCRDHERCLWVIDLRRDQMTLPQQVDLILGQHVNYELLSSQVEANSFQGGLYQQVEQKMDERGIALRVEPHYTSRVNKPDPETGVQAMAPWFENGKVHIPWGNEESRRKMGQFVDELIQYPGRTTDTVMAFWFAWRAAQVSGPKYESYNRLKQQAPGWGKMLGRRLVDNPYFAQDRPPEENVVYDPPDGAPGYVPPTQTADELAERSA